MTRKRKIIVSVATSADGFIARTDGSVDWLDRPRPKGNYGMGDFYKSIDTDPLGQENLRHGASVSRERRCPDRHSTLDMKNYVFTHTPPPSAAPKEVEFVNQPIKRFASRLRAKKGKDIWIMGGAGIIASFLDEGEVDEFILSVVPVLIGEGIPLLAPRHRTVPLKLLASTKFADGLVKLHYSVS